MEPKADWRIVSLIPDSSSNRICRHFKERIIGLEEAAVSVSPRMENHDLAHEIASAVGYSGKKILGLYGSGSYHHMTYGLCRIARDLSPGFTYIHIDNHNDCNYKQSGLDCGSFVRNIIEDGYAKEFILVGSCHPRASAYVNEFDFRRYPQDVAPRILSHVKTDDVYISADLDVMNWDEVSTSLCYSRSTLGKTALLDLIERIKLQKRIISADILGHTWSPFPGRNRKSKILYEDIARAIIGSEWDQRLK